MGSDAEADDDEDEEEDAEEGAAASTELSLDEPDVEGTSAGGPSRSSALPLEGEVTQDGDRDWAAASRSGMRGRGAEAALFEAAAAAAAAASLAATARTSSSHSSSSVISEERATGRWPGARGKGSSPASLSSLKAW